MRLIEDTRARSAYLLLLLAVLHAGDAWRYAFGWWAWAVLASVLVVASVGVLIVHRDRWAFGSLPYPLLVFMLLATVSIAWSAYPAATALGLVTTWATVIAGVAAATLIAEWTGLALGLWLCRSAFGPGLAGARARLWDRAALRLCWMSIATS